MTLKQQQNPKNAKGKQLSELELVVIGAVWRRPKCTAYQIRQEFAESPTSRWSASRGAIYPLLKKLESRGLLKSQVVATDGRKTRLLDVTSKGKSELKSWFERSSTDDGILREYDALRTKLQFIEFLPPIQQKQFLNDAEQKLVEQRNMFRRLVQKLDDDLIEYVIHVGRLEMCKTRLRWIRFVRQELFGDASGKPVSRKNSQEA